MSTYSLFPLSACYSDSGEAYQLPDLDIKIVSFLDKIQTIISLGGVNRWTHQHANFDNDFFMGCFESLMAQYDPILKPCLKSLALFQKYYPTNCVKGVCCMFKQPKDFNKVFPDLTTETLRAIHSDLKERKEDLLKQKQGCEEIIRIIDDVGYENPELWVNYYEICKMFYPYNYMTQEQKDEYRETTRQKNQSLKEDMDILLGLSDLSFEDFEQKYRKSDIKFRNFVTDPYVKEVSEELTQFEARLEDGSKLIKTLLSLKNENPDKYQSLFDVVKYRRMISNYLDCEELPCYAALKSVNMAVNQIEEICENAACENEIAAQGCINYVRWDDKPYRGEHEITIDIEDRKLCLKTKMKWFRVDMEITDSNREFLSSSEASKYFDKLALYRIRGIWSIEKWTHDPVCRNIAKFILAIEEGKTASLETIA